jgi:hypothetical protein
MSHRIDRVRVYTQFAIRFIKLLEHRISESGKDRKGNKILKCLISYHPLRTKALKRFNNNSNYIDWRI